LYNDLNAKLNNTENTLNDLNAKYDIVINENKTLKDEIVELESKHNQTTRDLSATKKVKIEIESSNSTKLDNITKENANLKTIIQDLQDKHLQLDKNKNIIQTKVEQTMEEYKKAVKQLNELQLNNASLSTQLKDLTTQHTQAVSDLESNKTTSVELSKKVDQLNDIIDKNHEEFNQLNSKYNSKEEELHNVNQQHQDIVKS
jgi:chromosome segregation ATPase